MDPKPFANSTGNAPRKVKCAPNAPVKKERKPTLPKAEKVENGIDEAQAQQLLLRLHESSFKENAKVESKVGTRQVAFGYEGRSNSIKSFGTPKFINKGSSSDVLLDEEEFGEDTERSQYEENESNSTVNLGLMEDEQETRMIFLQLPATMPILKHSSNTEGENQDKNLKNSEKGGRSSQKPCSLEALPAGFMGKMPLF